MNEPELRFKADDGTEFPNWKEKQLGKMFDISAGGDISKSDCSETRSPEFCYPVYANALTNDGLYGYANYYKIDGDSVTITGRGDIGFAIARHCKYVPIVRLIVLHPCMEENVDFFANAINSIRIPKEYTGVPQLTAPQVSQTKLMVPCIEEQQKIANLFSALDNVIDSVQKEVDSWEQMKRGVMQKLFSQEVRFKADDRSEFPEWKTYSLSDFTSRLMRKNKNNETDIPLTISSQLGLVDQREYFSKTIASKDLTGYFLLKNGEFAYNKSYSVGFDYGSIKRLDKYNQGAVSTLYICFTLSDNKIANSDFMVHYFDSNIWNHEAKKICAEGARNHGLLNVSPDDFFNMSIKLPCLEEQQKIADCLSEFDSVIEKTKQKLEAYKQLKKGLMQRMFA